MHVRSPDGEAKIWLAPEVRVAGSQGFDAATLRELVEIARLNKDLIERAWNDHFGA